MQSSRGLFSFSPLAMGAAQNKDAEWALRVERYTERTLRELSNNVDSGACCRTRNAVPASQSARGTSKAGTGQRGRQALQQHGLGSSGKFAFTAVGGTGGDTVRRRGQMDGGDREPLVASVKPADLFPFPPTVSAAQSLLC